MGFNILNVCLLQARVKEVSVVAAGSDGPIQRPGRGAWEPGPTGIPPLFVSGCVGDLREARDKWEAAKQWRHDFQIDQVRQGQRGRRPWGGLCGLLSSDLHTRQYP